MHVLSMVHLCVVNQAPQSFTVFLKIMSMCVHRSADAHGSQRYLVPGDGVIGSCELPDLGLRL